MGDDTAASLYADPHQWARTILPDDRPQVLAEFRGLRTNVPTVSIEYRIVRPDGAVRWLHDRGFQVRDAAGRVTRIAGLVTDITERKLAEEALRTSEERFRTTLETMLEGCQIIGRDWRYLYMNASAVQHGRRSADELLGRTMMEAYPGIEDTEMFAILQQCMTERVARQIENEFVYADGSSSWFVLVVQPVPEGIFVLSPRCHRAQTRRAGAALEDCVPGSPGAFLDRRNPPWLSTSEGQRILQNRRLAELFQFRSTW